jgi:hypothetical protein
MEIQSSSVAIIMQIERPFQQDFSELKLGGSWTCITNRPVASSGNLVAILKRG